MLNSLMFCLPGARLDLDAHQMLFSQTRALRLILEYVALVGIVRVLVFGLLWQPVQTYGESMWTTLLAFLFLYETGQKPHTKQSNLGFQDTISWLRSCRR